MRGVMEFARRYWDKACGRCVAPAQAGALLRHRKLGPGPGSGPGQALRQGDEFGHTQRGNNNAYCQDNETSWLDWSKADPSLADFVAHLLRLRRECPALRCTSWLNDHPQGDGHRDTVWLAADATASRAMTVEDWHDTQRHCLGLHLSPRGMTPALLIVNAEPAAVKFTLPAGRWLRQLDSASGNCESVPVETPAIDVPAHGVVLLTSTRTPR